MKLRLIFLMIFLGGCNDGVYQNHNILDPIDIKFQLDKITDDQYNLTVNVEIDSGWKIVSPYSNDTDWIHFNISLADSTHLVLVGKPTEIATTYDEFEPISESEVKWVKGNAKYIQAIKLLVKDNFQAKGEVEFMAVAEDQALPPESKNFIILYKSGRMTIMEKIKNIGSEVNVGLLVVRL